MQRRILHLENASCPSHLAFTAIAVAGSMFKYYLRFVAWRHDRRPFSGLST